MNPVKIVLALVLVSTAVSISLTAQNIWKDSEELGNLLKHQDTLRPSIKFAKKAVDIYHEGKKVAISDNDTNYLFKRSGYYECIIKHSTMPVTFISRKDTFIYKGIHKLAINYKISYISLRPIKEYIVGSEKDSLIYRRKGQLKKHALNAIDLPYTIDSIELVFKPIKDNILPYSTLVLTQTAGQFALHLSGKAEMVIMNQKLFEIIKPYIVSPETQTIEDQKLEAFKKNPYFSGIKDWLEDEEALEIMMNAKGNKSTPDSASQSLPPYYEIGETAAQELKQNAQNVYASAPSLGAIDQTAFLRGLAAFIEKRAQEELNILFLNRLRKNLDQSDLGTLFPNSKDQFNRFELSSYKNTLEQALPALRKDMSQIGLNFSELILRKNELKDNAAVYTTAFLIGLIQQSLNGTDLDRLLLYTHDYHQKRINKIKQQKDEKLVKKLSLYSQTKVDSILLKADTFLTHIDSLIINIDINLNNLSDSDLANLQINPSVDPSGLLKTRFEFWNYKLGNTIDLLNNLKKELRDLHTKLTHLEWRYLNKFDYANIDYTIEQFDTLFGPSRPSPIELLDLIKSTSDGKHLTDLKKILKESEHITDNLANIKQEMQVYQVDSLQHVLDAYKEYWLLKQGLALEKARWLPKDTSSNQEYLVIHYLLKALEHEEITSLVEAIKSNFFEKYTPFRPSDQVFQTARTMGQMNSQFSERIKSYWEKWKVPKNTDTYPQVNHYLEIFDTLKKRYLEKYEMIRRKDPAGKIDSFCVVHITPLLTAIKAGINNQEAKLKVNPFLEQNFDQTREDKPDPRFSNTSHLLSPQVKQVIDNLGQQLANSIKLAGSKEDSINITNANHFITIAQLGMDLLRAFSTSKIDTILVPQQKVRSNKLVSYNYASDANQRSIVQQDSVTVIEKKILHIRKWMNREEFQALMMDQYKRPMFLGLLYHQLQVNTTSILDEKFAPEVLANQVIHLVFMLDQLQIAREQKQNQNIQLNLKDYLPVTQVGIQLIKSILNVPVGTRTLGKEWKFEGVVKVLDEAVSLYENLDKKQYFYVLGNVIALYDQFVQEKNSKGEKDNSLEKFRQGLMKYGNFIAQTASAKDKDEVKNLLSEYALPPGSSQIKRLHDQNVSINGYLGPSIARNDSAGLLSLSTPVGLAYSFRVGANRHGYRTNFSIFASILDLGSIVSYDFSNKKMGNLDSLSFNDFLAPGIFLSYNINRSPFTIAAGYQGYPITIGQGKSVLRSRCNLSFLIDVPIFNLFSSRKLKNKPN